MKKYLKNITESNILVDDIGQLFVPDDVWEIIFEDNMEEEYKHSSDLETEILAGNIQVGSHPSTFYSNPFEGLLYLKTRFDDDAYLLDGTTITEVTPAIVYDEHSGKKSTTYFMNMLTVMRDMYNAVTNPVYCEDHIPILGESGYLVDHANRINLLETILGKQGWFNEYVKSGTYQKPYDLLIYYGWMNSFNYGVNSWTNEKVAQDMAKYSMIVLGEGISDSGHGDYSNTSVIIPRIKALNSYTQIFGYVKLDQTLANFKSEVDEWAVLGVDGIFVDRAGYDFGTTATNSRTAFNSKIDYIHGVDSTNSSMLAFVNAGNMDHIIGTTNDPSYPNSTWNSGLVASNLTINDWYLLESFAVNTTAYSGSGGYNTKSSWSSKGTKAINHRATYGINLASVGIIANDSTSAADLFDFSFVSACMFAFEAHGTSDTSYGSSSATVDFQDRPDVSNIGRIWAETPAIQVDSSDSDVYLRYVDFGRFKVDFSSGAQLSEITKR